MSSPVDITIPTITLPEMCTRQWLEEQPRRLYAADSDLRLDFGATRFIDSASAAFIVGAHGTLEQAGHRLVLVNISPALLETLEKWTEKVQPVKPSAKSVTEGGFAWLGGVCGECADQIRTALSILSEMVYWSTIGLIRHGRGFRKGALGDQMFQLGFKALGIVGLLALLIGVVLALQTAIQLKAFGADIFLAPMIGISMIRELGPLMTAIILAGRTGSATTAEIATMGVQEELDALRTMSINPVQFVVVPKFWAITLTMPLLSIIAVSAGIFGGYLVAVLYLEVASPLFWNELAKNIFFKDFMAGFIKSVVFSWLIIWIGSFYGFKVRGGAEEVGRETTASVVTCIFAIIVADAVFSFII